MENLTFVFKALSDETRLKMLALIIKHRELCVCDLVAVLKTTQSKASRHLRYLLHSGVLKDRRVGVWVHYRLSESLTNDLKTIVSTFYSIFPKAELKKLDLALLAERKKRENFANKAKRNISK